MVLKVKKGTKVNKVFKGVMVNKDQKEKMGKPQQLK